MPKILKKGKRYAFIDSYNTSNTTEQILNFVVDWEKLFKHLTDKWKCEKVFFYGGIELGDQQTATEYEHLDSLGYSMRTKSMMVYKRKDKVVELTCRNCGESEIKKIDMGYQRKSNCDVEMTMDIMLNAKEDNELLIFTGDGDFSAVIDYAIENSCKVKIVSNTCKGKGKAQRRFSTKLKGLFSKDAVIYIDINDWKDIIKKA